ncbi:MAG: hypothetical protein K9H26_10835 [Prolixibacteraceae bacterium]|nr:hypothetical protein [Prolixibacteraceae bacterium]
MNRINFSYNWNKKLDCNVFSTIRLWNPAKYYEGAEVDIWENSRKPALFRGRGRLLIVSKFKLHQLKPAAAWLDTGYSLEETRNILRKMYFGKVPDVEKQDFAYIIIEKIKEKPQQQKLI